MKMLIRVAGALRNWSSRVATTSSTRPSAGDTTRPSPGGATRSGSRKKYRQKAMPTTSGSKAAGCAARAPTAPTMPSTPATMPITGQPSRAIGIRCPPHVLPRRLRRPRHDVRLSPGRDTLALYPTRDEVSGRLLITCSIDQAVGGQPRHERPKLATDLLDRMRRGLLAQLAEVRLAAAVLRHPLVREPARLDVVEDLLHRLARLLADDAAAAGHVAVLGRVADRVAHVGDAALVDEVDDELHLVEALEVGHLGRVAPRHQRLVAGADELGQPAAQHGLLAEEISLGLLLERSLERRGTRAADTLRPRQGHLLGVPARILMDRDQARHAAALLVLAPHEMPGPLRRHHEHVDVRGGHDLLEVDVEPVAERQVLPLRQPRRDLVLVDLRALLVGDEHHDDVGLTRRCGRIHHPQADGLGLPPGRAVGAQADPDVTAAVAQVERVRMPLAAVPDDGDLLAPDGVQGRVLVVVDVHAARSLSFPSIVRSRVPRNIATRPVRTISLMPIGFRSSISASILSSVPVTSMTYERRDTSMILPRKMSTMLTISPRDRSSTATFTSTSWRSTWAVSVKSMTLMTAISLFSCFSICSSTWSSPRVTSVMRETVGSMVSATERLSMLKPRPLKSPATRARTPNSFSTRMEMVCRIDSGQD